MERVNNFLIGCDPEFVGINNGTLMNHSQTFRHEGPVGFDHSGWMLEVRPEPAYFARTLVRRIGRLLKDERVVALPRARAGAYWTGPVPGGTRTYGIGGHVHLGVTPYSAEDVASANLTTELLRFQRRQPGAVFSVNGLALEDVNAALQRTRIQPNRFSPDHQNRIGALDTFTMQLEHLDILPARESELRRDTTEYGKYGDVRIQGEPPRTEYRTMGSWLLSPSVAMVCLTGAKIAAADPSGVSKGNVNYDGLKTWFDKYKTDKDVAFMQEHILSKLLKHLQVDPDGDFRERWSGLR